MRPVLSPEEATRVDAQSTEPAEVLMERAGYAVAVASAAMGAGYGAVVAVLAGTGNNGGDGYVAARHLLHRGAAVVVHALGDPSPRASAAVAARDAAVADGVPVRSLAAPEPADLVVDALFGVGFHGALPAELVPWTSTTDPVLAVDVPSGLDAGSGLCSGPCFRTDRTITFHSLKTGHLLGDGPDRCGETVVVDIGLRGGDPALMLVEESDAPRPVRRRTDHKWSVGSVLVLGGAPGLTGAAMHAAEAALHAGAGAVAIACREQTRDLYARSADLLTHTAETPDEVAALGGRYDVLVAGPGAGDLPDGHVAALLTTWPGPVILDADGINALEGTGAVERRTAPTILTPHAGEFRGLTGEDPTPEAAAALADRTGAVVLLKGNPTFVMGTQRWVITSGGPELATIGTGDVLAGMIGAYAAAGLDAETAARSAAYHHGVAGRRLVERRGVVAASELAEEIGR